MTLDMVFYRGGVLKVVYNKNENCKSNCWFENQKNPLILYQNHPAFLNIGVILNNTDEIDDALLLPSGFIYANTKEKSKFWREIERELLDKILTERVVSLL